MSITKYEKSLSSYKKLIEFSRGLFIKDDRKANTFEDESSLNISSKFLSMLKNRYRLTDIEKTIYANKAILEGYSLLVSDLKIQFKELLGEAKFTYTGTRYVKDWYNVIDYSMYMMDRSRYGNIYERIGSASSYIYKLLDYKSVRENDVIYYKRKSGSIYRSVPYDDSLEYDTVYLLNSDILLTRIENNPTLNIYDILGDLIPNEYVVKNGINTWKISIKDLILERNSYSEAMFYKQESAVYLPLHNIQEVEGAVNLFKKVGLVYIPITKFDLILDTNIEFYFTNKLFQIDPDTSPYYTGSEIFLENSNNPLTLIQYYTNIQIDNFSNIYLKHNNGDIMSKVTLGGAEYLMGFNISEQSFTYTGLSLDVNEIDILILNKSKYCDACFSKYESKVDSNNDIYYKCSSCGIVKDDDHIFQMRKVFMFTYMNVLDNIRKNKGDLTHLKQVKETRASHNNNIALAELIVNTVNEDRETNEYYLELYKEGVDIVLARSVVNHAILKYPDNILTVRELDVFLTIYYKMSRYFESTMYNKAYEVYDNYINVVHFLIVSSTINRVIVDDYKNINDYETFSDRDIKNMLYSNGVYTFDRIPRSYKLLIMKKLTSLFKKRGTEMVIDEILEIFNSNSVNVFKYLMVKDFKRNEEDGSIIEADVYGKETLLNMKINSDGVGDGIIPTFENILVGRSDSIGQKYDLVDIKILKIKIRSLFNNNIKAMMYDDGLSNLGNDILITEFIKYIVDIFKVNTNGALIKDSVNKYVFDDILRNMSKNITDFLYLLKVDDIRELFIKNEILFEYDHFKDYVGKLKSIYSISKLESYSTNGNITDNSFYNATSSEKEMMVDNQPTDSILNDGELDHPYLEQMKFLISSIVINNVKKIKKLNLNGMRVALDKIGLENTPCPTNDTYDLSTQDGFASYTIKLSEMKTIYISKIISNISDDRFDIDVNVDYDIWNSVISVGDSLNYHDVYNNISPTNYITITKANEISSNSNGRGLFISSNLNAPLFKTNDVKKLSENLLFTTDNPLVFI